MLGIALERGDELERQWYVKVTLASLVTSVLIGCVLCSKCIVPNCF